MGQIEVVAKVESVVRSVRSDGGKYSVVGLRRMPASLFNEGDEVMLVLGSGINNNRVLEVKKNGNNKRTI